MEIDLKYMIPTKGKYNAGVYKCRECDCDLLHGVHGNVHRHIIGFSNAYIGLVAVVECPVCFCNWYFHARNTAYEHFLEFMEEGHLKHFDKSGNNIS